MSNKDALRAKLAAMTPQQRKALLAKTQAKKAELKAEGKTAPDKPVNKAPLTASGLGVETLSAEQLKSYASSAVSNAQVRMWMFDKFNQGNAAYNICSALHLIGESEGSIHLAGIEWAMSQIVACHQGLRTRFVEVAGQLKTQVLEPMAIRLEVDADCGWALPDDAEAVEQRILSWAAEPIDLSKPPLLKLKALRLKNNQMVLVLLMHHIIADGWSLRLLEVDLSKYYGAWLDGEREPQSPHMVQYQHFVGWQNQWLASPQALKQKRYWQQKLRGAPQKLALGRDLLATPDAPPLQARSVNLPISAELVAKVEQFGQVNRLSPFMIYLAAFNLVMHAYTGDEDITLGTPVANRRTPWVESILGLVSNTVALRNRCAGQMTIKALLDQVRETTLGAFANQELPFEQVVEAVSDNRSSDGPPVFQVLFALQATQESDLALPGMSIKPIELPRHAAEFVLTCEMFITSSGGFANFTYQIAGLADATVRALAAHFERMVGLMLEDPDKSIGRLLELTAAEPVRLAGSEFDCHTSIANPSEYRAGQVAHWHHPRLGLVVGCDGEQLYSPLALRLANDAGKPLFPGLVGQLQAFDKDAEQWLDTGLCCDQQGRHLSVVANHKCAWIDGQFYDMARLSSQLVTVEGIFDGVCLPQTTVDGKCRVVFYAVPESRAAQSVIAQRCQQLVGDDVPLSLCLVTELPMDAGGRLQASKLQSIEVIDSSVQAALDTACEGELSWSHVPWQFSQAKLTLAPPFSQAQGNSDEDEDCQGQGKPTAEVLTEEPPMEIDNLGALLNHTVALAPGTRVTSVDGFNSEHQISEYHHFSYSELKSEALVIAAGLQRMGIGKGDIVLCQLDNCGDILKTFWGCILLGAVFLDVEKPTDYSHVEDPEYTRVAHALEVLSVKAAVVCDSAKDDFAATLGEYCQVSAIGLQSLKIAAPLEPCVSCGPNDPVLMLLTSGSTGKPKVVVQNHGALCCYARSFAGVIDGNRETVCFNWMPLQHVGGIIMCHLPFMYLGAPQVHCPTAAIIEYPLRLLDMLSHFKAEVCWSPNFAYALINELLDSCDLNQQRWDLSSMRVLLNGGEAVVQSTVAHFYNQLSRFGLSREAITPIWGMSETSSGSLLNLKYDPLAQNDTNFVSVGHPVPGISFRVVDGDDKVLPQGRSGRLQAKGRLVLEGYYNNDEANRSSFTPDGWFNTGDLAIMDQGEIAIVGREKDLIIINGLNFHGLDIELCVESLSCVMDAHTAACAVRRANDNTDRLCVFFSAADDHELTDEQVTEQIRNVCGHQLGVVPTYLVPLQPEDFPRTSIGKIQRSQLAKAFGQGEFDHLLSGEQMPQVPAWFHKVAWVAEQLPDRATNVDLLVLVGAEGRQLSEAPVKTVSADLARLPEILAQHGDARVVEIVDCRMPCGIDVNWLTKDDGLGVILDFVKQLSRPVGLTVLSLDSYQFNEKTGLPQVNNPASAALSGLLAALSAEFDVLQTRLICTDTLDSPELMVHLCRQGGADMVMLHQDKRFVRCLKPLYKHSTTVRPEGKPQPCHLQVVLGGLGGVGSALCERLLSQSEGNVVAIGRRAKAEMAQQSHYAERLSRLESHQQRFAYVDVDMLDAAALRACFEQLQQRFGKLDKVYHLAGIARPTPLKLQSIELLGEIVAAKVQGSIALSEALASIPGVSQVHFCSLTAMLGGRHYSAYSLANAFQMAWCEQQKRQGQDVACLMWSMWADTGMSAGNLDDAAVRAGGYHLLDIEQGLLSLQMSTLMAKGKAGLSIGLDDHAMVMAPRLRRECHNVFSVQVQGEGRLPQCDNFGNPISYRRAGQDNQIDLEALENNPQYKALKGIMEKVLQVDDLPPTANFFELGGDSILAIQVVSQAAVQGMNFAPRDLFDQQTLVRLLAVIDDEKSTAIQDKLTGPVSLMPMHHWFFEQAFNGFDQMNQSVLLKVRGPLDVERLQGTLRDIVELHDILRARFNCVDGRWCAELVESSEIPFDQVDLSDVAAQDWEKALFDSCDQLQSTLELAQGPVFRARLITSNEADKTRLMLAVHHMVIDGVSWRTLVEDIIRIYTTGERKAVKTHSVGQWCKAIDEYLQTEQAEMVKDYWLGVSEAMDDRWQADLEGTNLRADETHLEVTCDGALTETLFTRLPFMYKVKADDLMLSALAQAYFEVCQGQSFAVLMEGHGRDIPEGMETLNLSRTIGWFTSMYPLVIPRHEGDDLACQIMRSHQALDAVPDGGASYNWLRYIAKEQGLCRKALPSISYNYLGRFDGFDDGDFSFAAEAPGKHIADSQQRPNNLDIVGRILDGQAAFSFIYSAKAFSRDKVAALVARFEQNLQQIAELGDEQWRAAYALTPIDRFVSVDVSVLPELATLYTGEAQNLSGLQEKVSMVLPATPVQLGVIFESLLNDSGDTYVSQLVNDISGNLDVECLRRAWQQVLEVHSIYRTAFVSSTSGQYVQVVHRHCQIPFTYEDWQGLAETLQNDKFEQLLNKDRMTGFDFEQPPLLRIVLVRMGSEKYRMLISEHHSVCDGWSRTLVLGLVADAYRQFKGTADNTALFHHEPKQYADYVRWMDTFDRQSADAYWQGLPLGEATTLPLAVQKLPGVDDSSSSSGLTYELSIENTDAVVAAARKAKVTTNTLAQAAWSLLLSTYTGSDTVVFGTTHSGRPVSLEGVNEIVGPLINTLPVVAQLDRQATVAQFLAQMHDEILQLTEWGYLSLSQIGNLHGRSDLSSVLNTLFVFENFPLTAPDAHDEDALKIDGVRSIDSTEYPLTFSVVPGERLKLLVYFLDNAYERAEVSKLCEAFERLLRAMSDNLQTPLGSLNWLIDGQQGQIEDGLQGHQDAALAAKLAQVAVTQPLADDDIESEDFEF